MTRKRRILLITAAILAAAIVLTLVFINAARPTIADFMKLTSPNQIVKIELAKCEDPYPESNFFPYGPATERLDITDTPLGKQYKDAIFSAKVEEYKPDDCYPKEKMLAIGKSPTYMAVVITVGNVRNDYPYLQKAYILPVDPLKKYDGDDFQGKPFMGVTLQGAGISKIEHTFSLPKSELFTPEFVERQLEQ